MNQLFIRNVFFFWFKLVNILNQHCFHTIHLTNPKCTYVYQLNQMVDIVSSSHYFLFVYTCVHTYNNWQRELFVLNYLLKFWMWFIVESFYFLCFIIITLSRSSHLFNWFILPKIAIQHAKG